MAGSTSTWPKSGLIVASRVRFDVSSCLEVAADAQILRLPSLNGSRERSRAAGAPCDGVGQHLEAARHAAGCGSPRGGRSATAAGLRASPERPLVARSVGRST